MSGGAPMRLAVDGRFDLGGLSMCVDLLMQRQS